MKIINVVANNHKHVFEVSARSQTLDYPYSRADIVPSSSDPIVELYIDAELAGEGFTYVLASGVEGSVLWDHVLDYNADPTYVANIVLHHFTTELKTRLEDSGLSIREVARRMRTSPNQVYRLLDPTNYSKPLRQMLVLASVLGVETEIQTKRASTSPRKAGRVPPSVSRVSPKPNKSGSKDLFVSPVRAGRADARGTRAAARKASSS